ncbi:FGGY family carbohydrate kinase, partial [Francisella tularensis subsp. holarctica]|uniref:FGGY family carbohydrate kinase n=1 Tax=Francisella tularensis TaxID=263 RepID=UPI002381ACFD
TNQRETVVVWEKETGDPVYNARVWQCRRTSSICDEIQRDPQCVKYIKENTGLVVDASFSGTKVKWILANVEGAREKAHAGKLL